MKVGAKKIPLLLVRTRSYFYNPNSNFSFLEEKPWHNLYKIEHSCATILHHDNFFDQPNQYHACIKVIKDKLVQNFSGPVF